MKLKIISSVILSFSLVFLCALGGFAADLSNAELPEWYDFNEDSYYFSNIEDDLNPNYYYQMFGPQKGRVMYLLGETGSPIHGMCFGMALTTAATFLDSPAVSSYYSARGYTYENIGELRCGTISDDIALPLKSYIKYAQLYQSSSASLLECKENSDDLQGLYDAVYDFVYNGGDPVIVGLIGEYGHEILAVGLLDGNILVDDSNDRSSLNVININRQTGEWSYSCAGLDWSSSLEDNHIDYSTDVLGPYILLKEGMEESGGEAARARLNLIYYYSTIEEITGLTDILATDIKPVDYENMILSYQPEYFDTTEDFEDGEIGWICFTDDENDFESYCWLIGDNGFSARNTSAKDGKLSLTGNALEIDATVPALSYSDIRIGDSGKGSIAISTEAGKKVSVTFYEINPDDYSEKTMTVTGTSVKSEIDITKTCYGYQICGLDEVNCEYNDGKLFSLKKTVKTGDCANLRISVVQNKHLTYSTNSFSYITSGELLGDADLDKSLTASDARTILRMSVSLENYTESDVMRLDTDFDGELTSADARNVLRASVGLSQCIL